MLPGSGASLRMLAKQRCNLNRGEGEVAVFFSFSPHYTVCYGEGIRFTSVLIREKKEGWNFKRGVLYANL